MQMKASENPLGADTLYTDESEMFAYLHKLRKHNFMGVG